MRMMAPVASNSGASLRPAGSFPPSIRGGARARTVSERNAPSGERRASGVSPSRVAPERVKPARLAAAAARSRSIAPQSAVRFAAPTHTFGAVLRRFVYKKDNLIS